MFKVIFQSGMWNVILCIEILKPQRKIVQPLYVHRMFVNPHSRRTIAYFQFLELQIILLSPIYESSLDGLPDSMNTCFALTQSVSEPLCYDLCRQMSSLIALKMLARDELLPQAEKLGCSSQITLSYIPLNHGNVLSSLKHEAIATLDTSFVENTSDIQQCFVEGFS